MEMVWGKAITKSDPHSEHLEVTPGEKCICPGFPFCTFQDCLTECPACEPVVLFDQEREARWVETGEGPSPVDSRLHGDHTGHNAFQQRSAS